MIGTSLMVLVTLGQAPPLDEARLVPALGAPRYDERESAASALERLGRKALPALQVARGDRDPEVRSRAATLVNKIEGSLLTQPTLVKLDFDERPLPDVIQELSEQTGIRLTLVPENAPHWRLRKVSLHEPSPLPFWTAMDRLCEAARLSYNPGVNGSPGVRGPVFPLFEGGMRPTTPTVVSGPFRVSVLGLHYQRDVSFPPLQQGVGNGLPPARRGLPGSATIPALPAVNEQFYAQIQVIAEPRLTLPQVGSLRIVEALDDRGQALVDNTSRASFSQRNAAYFGMSTGSIAQLQATLTRPGQPGRTIRKLRGILPLTVASRKPNPLVVSLAGARGKTFKNDDVALTVHDVRSLGNNRQATIELSIRPLSTPPVAVVPGSTAFGIHRPDTYQQQIDVADGQGRAMAWYPSGMDVEAGRITMTVSPQGMEAKVAPADLRFYTLTRAATELSFEFKELPLP